MWSRGEDWEHTDQTLGQGHGIHSVCVPFSTEELYLIHLQGPYVLDKVKGKSQANNPGGSIRKGRKNKRHPSSSLVSCHVMTCATSKLCQQGVLGTSTALTSKGRGGRVSLEPHISNHGLGHTDSGYSKYQVPTWLTVPPSLYSQRTKKVKKKKNQDI